MSAFVLSHLRTAMAHAEHVGFVHGGETLTHPLFFDFLAAVREARGRASTMVHLLTNGMLLSEKATYRMSRSGVRSISVSLDGATASSNDGVRRGGSFTSIVRRLEEVVDARSKGRLDLRIGISTVVLPGNIDELGEIVRLAARIGVDWVKFEELVRSTPFAATSLRRFDEGRARSAVRTACREGESLGLTMVDHTREMPRWICEMGASGERERHRADEFANRAALNPCRDAWDLACIEPNGDVHIGRFGGTLAGNVTERPFLEVWNSAPARAERVRAGLARRCVGGDIVCLSLPRAATPTPSHMVDSAGARRLHIR